MGRPVALLVLSLAFAAPPAAAQVIGSPCGVGGGMLVWSSVRVEVRDDRGRPVARGATLELRDGAFRLRTSPRESYDSLVVGSGHPVAGTFRVRVTKPGYAPAETTGVHVPAGPCGPERAVTVALVLRELPNAGRVRSVTIMGSGIGLGPEAGIGVPLEAYVDAVPGVDTSVIWSSSDTSVLTVSRDGVVRSKSLRCRRMAAVTTSARADPRRRAHLRIEVFGTLDTERYCLSLRSRPDGATRAALVAGASWPPHQSEFSGQLAPFVTDHLQAGVAWSRSSPADERSLEVLATHHVGGHWKSRPHIGVFLAASDGRTRESTTALGARVGWTYFTSPAVAARAEARYWAPEHGRGATEAFLAMEPYVLGSARVSRRAPAPGVIDVTVIGRARLTGPREASAELMVAPFLTRWVQIGGALSYARSDTARITARWIEGFGRLYLPLESRVTPFVGAFGGTARATSAGAHAVYGPLLGARTHLNRDVALDVVVRHIQGGDRGGRTALAIGMVTQLRTRGRIRAETF